MIVLGERRSDRQLVPYEQRQRFDLNMTVALEPSNRCCQAIEADAEPVLQFGSAATFEPGGDGIGQDRRFRCPELRGERLETVADRLGPEKLVADLLDHGQRSICRRSEEPTSEIQSLL